MQGFSGDGIFRSKHVCMHVRMYAIMHACMHVYVRTYVRMCMCIHARQHHVCICTHLRRVGRYCSCKPLEPRDGEPGQPNKAYWRLLGGVWAY